MTKLIHEMLTLGSNNHKLQLDTQSTIRLKLQIIHYKLVSILLLTMAVLNVPILAASLDTTTELLTQSSTSINRRSELLQLLLDDEDYPPELQPLRPSEPLRPDRIFPPDDASLPVCSQFSVCSKISTYSTPYAQRMCRCPGQQNCSTSLDLHDGHTVPDKTTQFKLCEPVHRLPECKLFTDVSYTMVFYPDNSTQLLMHCVCPKNALAYILHRDPYRSSRGFGYFYSFACSPLKLQCRRKEPCRLFSARKLPNFQEVTTTVLCRCPSNRRCPAKHTDHGVVPARVYSEHNIRTYSGYCV